MPKKLNLTYVETTLVDSDTSAQRREAPARRSRKVRGLDTKGTILD